MFLPDGPNQAQPPSGVADITPAEPETTSADIALMQRVLSAASRNPNLIPADFMSYVLDWIQTQRLQIPVGQVFGYPKATRTVAGTVAADGTISTGTGFTIAKGVSGLYTITFAAPFSVTPAVVVTPIIASGGNRTVSIRNNSASSVDVVTGSDAGVGVDQAFGFLATIL